VAEHRQAIVVGVVVVPLVAVWVDEEDVVRKGRVVVYDVAAGGVSLRVVARYEGGTYVRYTMLSLPLFFGTVSGAFGSSTR
jgi:hypothetical protein